MARRRSTIDKMVQAKIDKIKQLKTEIIELNREAVLLTDKKQQFTEKEEEVLICGRPKKYETQLIGRIHWKDYFMDDDTGEKIWINRTQIVRVNGEWQ